MHTIFCLVGESGSGKTTIQKELEKKGLTAICSYTTRPPRYEGEDSHTFCDDAEYEKFLNSGEIVAYTNFGGYHYFCTKHQALTSDLYVVDPDGITELREKMNNILNIVVIGIFTPEEIRTQRLLEIGESEEKVQQRLKRDAEMFSEERWKRALPDGVQGFCVINDELDEAVEQIFDLTQVYK